MKPTRNGAPCASAGVGNPNAAAAVARPAEPIRKRRRSSVFLGAIKDIGFSSGTTESVVRGLERRGAYKRRSRLAERFFPCRNLRKRRLKPQDRLSVF